MSILIGFIALRSPLKSSMGILPMSLTGVPPVSSLLSLLFCAQRRRNSNHGQDARETHGRDAHATPNGLFQRAVRGADGWKLDVMGYTLWRGNPTVGILWAGE
jgi:hypothetical protein